MAVPVVADTLPDDEETANTSPEALAQTSTALDESNPVAPVQTSSDSQYNVTDTPDQFNAAQAAGVIQPRTANVTPTAAGTGTGSSSGSTTGAVAGGLTALAGALSGNPNISGGATQAGLASLEKPSGVQTAQQDLGLARTGAGLASSVASDLGDSSAASALGTAGQLAGLAAIPLDVYNFVKNYHSGATGADAINGAETGAAIGSVIPVVGTAIGAIGGAIVGAISSAFGGGELDPENANWDKFVPAYNSLNPTQQQQMLSQINPATTFQLFAGVMDAKDPTSGHSEELEQVFGKGSENQIMTQMANQINTAISSGKVAANSTPAQLYSSVITPWLNSKGVTVGMASPTEQGAIATGGGTEGAAMNGVLTSLIGQWQSGQLNANTPVGVAGQKITGLPTYGAKAQGGIVQGRPLSNGSQNENPMIQRYKEYLKLKGVKGYADGGEVDDEQDDSSDNSTPQDAQSTPSPDSSSDSSSDTDSGSSQQPQQGANPLTAVVAKALKVTSGNANPAQAAQVAQQIRDANPDADDDQLANQLTQNLPALLKNLKSATALQSQSDALQTQSNNLASEANQNSQAAMNPNLADQVRQAEVRAPLMAADVGVNGGAAELGNTIAKNVLAQPYAAVDAANAQQGVAKGALANAGTAATNAGQAATNANESIAAQNNLQNTASNMTQTKLSLENADSDSQQSRAAVVANSKAYPELAPLLQGKSAIEVAYLVHQYTAAATGAAGIRSTNATTGLTQAQVPGAVARSAEAVNAAQQDIPGWTPGGGVPSGGAPPAGAAPAPGGAPNAAPVAPSTTGTQQTNGIPGFNYRRAPSNYAQSQGFGLNPTQQTNAQQNQQTSIQLNQTSTTRAMLGASLDEAIQKVGTATGPMGPLTGWTSYLDSNRQDVNKLMAQVQTYYPGAATDAARATLEHGLASPNSLQDKSEIQFQLARLKAMNDNLNFVGEDGQYRSRTNDDFSGYDIGAELASRHNYAVYNNEGQIVISDAAYGSTLADKKQAVNDFRNWRAKGWTVRPLLNPFSSSGGQ